MLDSDFGQIAVILLLAAVVGAFAQLLRQPLIVAYIAVGIGLDTVPATRSREESLMSEVEVKEQRLPGVGWSYEIPAGEQSLVLVVEDRGPRHLMLVGPYDDEPICEARISASTATALAALLTGARMTRTPPGEPSSSST